MPASAPRIRRKLLWTLPAASTTRNAAGIEAEREALEKKSQAEESRWHEERTQLEAALKRARG